MFNILTGGNFSSLIRIIRLLFGKPVGVFLLLRPSFRALCKSPPLNAKSGAQLRSFSAN